MYDTPITSVDAFYKEVDHLISLLQSAGLKADADKLHSLLHECAWTTGSELIEELGGILGEMYGSYPHEIRKKLNDCHHFATHYRKILRLG